LQLMINHKQNLPVLLSLVFSFFATDDRSQVAFLFFEMDQSNN